MNDYLEEYKKYKDDKEAGDLISDIEKLRYLYNCQNFQEMMNHINELTNKYKKATIVWNAVNPVPASNYYEMYQNAENFLKAKLMVRVNSMIKQKNSMED